MKTILLLPLALALVTAGCGQSSSDGPQPVFAPDKTEKSGVASIATAPVDYLKSAADAHHTATKAIDLTSVTKAIELFQVEKGRFPKDLDELVKEKFMPFVPTPPFGSKLVYDATAGTVKIIPQ